MSVLAIALDATRIDDFDGLRASAKLANGLVTVLWTQAAKAKARSGFERMPLSASGFETLSLAVWLWDSTPKRIELTPDMSKGCATFTHSPDKHYTTLHTHTHQSNGRLKRNSQVCLDHANAALTSNVLLLIFWHHLN